MLEKFMRDGKLSQKEINKLKDVLGDLGRVINNEGKENDDFETKEFVSPREVKYKNDNIEDKTIIKI